MPSKRLIGAPSSELRQWTAADLKEGIRNSEGRTLMAQTLMFSTGIVNGVTNAEVEAAFGADMILLNGYSLAEDAVLPALQKDRFHPEKGHYTVAELKQMLGLPVGLYMEAGGGVGNRLDKQYDKMMSDRFVTPDNVRKALAAGASYLCIGGNPGTGVKLETIPEYVRMAREVVGDQMLIMAGKWEDGVTDPVLGDPLAQADPRQVIRDLIDAGADVITLPAPGSRTGITVEMIRQLVVYAHQYKEGTLCLDFLDGSVEGADVDTIREIALMMKQTGADIHAIGDGGLAGCAVPENILQMSITLKGRRHTYVRMAGHYR